MTRSLWAVVMAGGSGTRFWPVGRRALPKQLLEIEGGRTLIQATIDRLPDDVPRERVLVMTGADQAAALRGQIDLPEANVVGEPARRDTAPCIALAAALIARRDPEAVMAVMAADHVIAPRRAFHAALATAVRAAERPDALVAIGIEPRYPATGFGYVRLGDEVEDDVHEVAAFVEKPPLEVAERYVADGRHVWNAGIFVWRARAVLDALALHLPEVAAGALRIAGSDDPAVLAGVYPDLPAISIDYGVMEKAAARYCVRGRFDWDDVGSLLALGRHNPADAAGNVALGDVVLEDARDSIACNREDGVLALLGVSGIIAVRTRDAVLVAAKKDAERVKRLVERLEAEGRGELL